MDGTILKPSKAKNRDKKYFKYDSVMVSVLALWDGSHSCQTNSKATTLAITMELDNEFEINFLEPCKNITG